MAFSLQSKIALITGVTSGIGRATAYAFAEAGAALVLCARDERKLKELSADLREKYQSSIHEVILDVRSREMIQTALGELPAEFSQIDILVNNAGLARGLDKLHEGNPDEWEEMIDSNLKGLLFVSRAIIPGMVARQRGHIINIGSMAGHRVYLGGAVYCATKHAVDAITRGLKKDLEGTPLRVTAVDPGAVETNFSLTRFHGDQARADAVYKNIRPLRSEDIADVILFCATRPDHVNISDLMVVATDQPAWL
jgi:3-hydroxy acid dehydrogenase/malonic semialdehyde reductase